jgi:heme/copper-type cytochrome/quinol oxidase subunit 3
LPFTAENTLINSAQRLLAIFSSILFGIPFIALQLFAYRSIAEALAVSAGILALTFWINFFVFVKAGKK